MQKANNQWISRSLFCVVFWFLWFLFEMGQMPSRVFKCQIKGLARKYGNTHRQATPFHSMLGEGLLSCTYEMGVGGARNRGEMTKGCLAFGMG